MSNIESKTTGVRETLISNDDKSANPEIDDRRNSIGTQVSIVSQHNSTLCLKQMPKNQMLFFCSNFPDIRYNCRFSLSIDS